MLVALGLLLILSSDPCSSYRILGFFPFPGVSHHYAFAPVLHQLAKRGHQVVYLTPVKPKFSHPNLDVRLIKDFKAKFLEHLDLIWLGQAPIPWVSHLLSRAAEELPEYFYGDPEAQKIIHGSETYDAVLMESYFAQEPVSALIHKFGCVGVEISSLGDCAWVNEMSGLPDNSAYQIDFKSVSTDNMTPLERLYNFYVTWSTVLVSYYHLWEMQSVMDRYFNYTGSDSRPPLTKLVSNRSMILVNRHVALDYPYPKAPHVKDIGGINIVPNKPLPKDIKEFMDSSKEGVIYVSLGSNLKTSELLSGDLGDAFLHSFQRLRQKVLMKWESDEPMGLPSNVKVSKWLPQQDILAHENCALFITHGGFMSLAETVYYGVPVIGIPFFGDQPKNMKQVQSAGFGVQLSYSNITRESVSWALHEILDNPRYKEEAVRRSRMMREEKTAAVESAAHWVEHAIKYPNALTPKAAFLSFAELHNIDIYLYIIISTFLLYNALHILISMIVGPQSQKLKTL